MRCNLKKSFALLNFIIISYIKRDNFRRKKTLTQQIRPYLIHEEIINKDEKRNTHINIGITYYY